MLGDDERETDVAQSRQGAIGLDRQTWGESGGRLVEHQHLRIRHERPADGEHLLLATAQRAGVLLAALGEPWEQVEHDLFASRGGSTGEGAEGEVLGD